MSTERASLLGQGLLSASLSLPDGAEIAYEEPGILLIRGDCREILPLLPKVDLCLTDPPYGIGIGGSGRIGGSGVVQPRDYGVSSWDDVGLTPEQFDAMRSASADQIIFGFNHLSDVLPPTPSVLIWDKKVVNGWDDTFSDAEIAWSSLAGHAKVFRHLWMGALRGSEKSAEARAHPTQKPVVLMRWCLGFAPDAATILDPFMGSGTTLVAAKQLGRQAIGIEIEERYCEIAARRVRETTPPLPGIHEPEPVQACLPE